MSLTILDDYTPSPSEIKLIEVLSDPKNLTKSITAKCKLAGISRQTYYDIMKKPEFLEYYNKLIYESLKSRIAEVIEACYKFGITEKSCHADRKILLQMAGFYKDEQNINVKQQTEVCDATEEELREALAKIEAMKAIEVDAKVIE